MDSSARTIWTKRFVYPSFYQKHNSSILQAWQIYTIHFVGSFLFSIDCFYIYMYCRKFNAEFNKLIKTVGHCCFPKKMMLTTPTFANNFDFIWVFSYSHLSCPWVVSKHLKCYVCKFCALIGCHCTKSSHKMCKTSWWKNNWLCCCESVNIYFLIC